MSELIERLRELAEQHRDLSPYDHPVCAEELDEAADEIERLEGALRWALGESPPGMPEFPTVDGPPYYRWRTKLRELSGISPLREALDKEQT